MITEKQKCIAEQAVYGLKLEYIDATITAKGYDTTDNVCGVLFWNDKGKKEIVFERDCTPILRPLSDLTKEITHKGYNDDKPFVPIIKLFEHLQGLYLTEQDKTDFEIFFNSDSDSYEHDVDGWCVMIFDDLKLEINVCGVPAFFCYDTDSFNWKYNFTKVSQSYYDLLHLWHFDTRTIIEKGEAIDVNTLSINPYSV